MDWTASTSVSGTLFILCFKNNLSMEPAYALAYHFTSLSQLVEEDGIEPSPWDFQSPVHTKYTTLPLKLVAVLWVSTPLSPQRAASKPISMGNSISPLGKFPFMSRNPFYHGPGPFTCVSSHLDKNV